MKKLSFVTLLLISILAPAFSYATPNPDQVSTQQSSENPSETLETEILIEEPGFDKKLSMLLLNPEITRFDIKIINSSNMPVFYSTLAVSDEGIAEIDLTDQERGFYQLVLTLGEKE